MGTYYELDLVIFDEYHFGAWRKVQNSCLNLMMKMPMIAWIWRNISEEADNAYNETFLPITTSRYLYLSGTPFRALNSGEY